MHHSAKKQLISVLSLSLQPQFSLTTLLCLRSDTRHYGHINHCSYLLTYLLTPVVGPYVSANISHCIKISHRLDLVL